MREMTCHKNQNSRPSEVSLRDLLNFLKNQMAIKVKMLFSKIGKN